MKITILTLFPEMFDGFLTNSIIKRAIAKDLVEINIVNIRDYTQDKHHRVDSAPIGGGAGLIMKCQPIVDCLNDVKGPYAKTILLSPRGDKFNQAKAHEYLKEEELVIVCGHYEGIDERVNNYVDELVSIGDFILTGGEIGAMAISDAVIRLIDGSIASESTVEESFEDGLLEYPQYTEPVVFQGAKVPDILYSGNHEAIRKWRKRESLVLTRKHRPDLFAKYELTKQDKKLLEETKSDSQPKWETTAINKGKKFIK